MALPSTPEARAVAWRQLKEFLREQEAEHLRLLSMWVSELEPEFVYSRSSMQLMGITVKGWRELVFYAKGWTRSAQVTHDLWLEALFCTPLPVRHYAIPRDFHWNVGIDLGVETPDRTTRTVFVPELKISVSAKDISPELGRRLLAATMPKVQK